MMDEGVTQANHERPGIQPSQADDLVDEQAQQPDAVAMSIVLRVISLPRSQPMPIRSGAAQMSCSAKKVASVSAKALGCSGAFSQKNNVWLSDSMRSPGRIASKGIESAKLWGDMSVPLVVVVIVIRLILGKRDDRALVGIDPDIEDLDPTDDLHVIDPTLLRVLVLGT